MKFLINERGQIKNEHESEELFNSDGCIIRLNVDGCIIRLNVDECIIRLYVSTHICQHMCCQHIGALLVIYME